MSINTVQTGQEYLKAWAAKDLNAIASHLHPDLLFKGPLTELKGREAFLGACERIFPLLTDFKVRSVFASGNQAMFAYDFVCRAPIGVCRTAELVTFQDGLIQSIELFYDARPFEKMAS